MSPEMEELPRSNRMGGYDLLPKYFPSGELLGPYKELLGALSEETKEYSEDELRTIHWTIALEIAFENSRFTASVPGFQMATYGFTNPEVEQPAFGVFVYTAPSEFQETFAVNQRAESPQLENSSPYAISAGDARFPVIIRPRQIRLHSLPTNPIRGTATCWARSKRPGLSQKTAFLTAKHIFQKPVIGRRVPLTTGSGRLLDVGPDGIDAALVEVNQATVAISKQLRSRRLIAQWIDVDLHTQHSVVRTKVLEVNSSRGSLHWSLPLRIFLGYTANQGDSGSLVTTPGGVGIGIYIGGVKNPATGVYEGFCQHLAQAASALQADLWL